MFKTFRKFGPVLMVPAAWSTAILAIHTELMPQNGLLVAHLVMISLMILFLVTGWKKMNRGVLKAWRTVLLVGLPLTVMGALGLLGIQKDIFTAASLFGWFFLPGSALVYTGKKDERFGSGYTVSGLFSLLGFFISLLSLYHPLRYEFFSFSGFFLVLVGQSTGIFFAAYQNS